MKKCSFCAEQIQNEAIKCRYCGEMLTKSEFNEEEILVEEHPVGIAYLPMLVVAAIFVIFPFIFYYGFSMVHILAMLIGLSIIIWAVLDKRCRKYTVTNKRVITEIGVIAKHKDEIDMQDIRSVHTRQGVLERLLGYGDVLIGTAGTAEIEIKIDSVTNPKTLAKLIKEQKAT